MGNSSYPALLNKRATILGSLNRTDLVFLGVVFLIFSYLKVSGIAGLLANIGLLVGFKVLKAKLPVGFLEGVRSPVELHWNQSFGESNE